MSEFQAEEGLGPPAVIKLAVLICSKANQSEPQPRFPCVYFLPRQGSAWPFPWDYLKQTLTL